MAGYAQVATTTDSREAAQAVARAALEARHAACVQILGPVESRYWWKGTIEAAEEWLCLLKTSAACVDDLCRTIRAAHPYETPEIVVTDLAGGSADYLAWIDAETSPSR